MAFVAGRRAMVKGAEQSADFDFPMLTLLGVLR